MMLRNLYDRLRAIFPPNRVVALLAAPAAALAGWLAAWVAAHFPGVHLDQGQLTAIFIAGGTALVVQAYKWLDNWGKYEEHNRTMKEIAAAEGSDKHPQTNPPSGASG
jgi:hypothetical protein